MSGGRPAFDPRPVVLEAPGLRLEPLAPGHAPGIAAAGADGATFAHLAAGPFAAEADAAAWIETARADAAARGDVPFAVLDTRGPGPVVAGSTRFLAVRREHRGLEIGWTWLAPAWCGTGFDARVKRRLLAHVVEDRGAVRVESKTNARNERSQRAMLRIGCTREGVLRRHMARRDGTWRDSVSFSIVDVDWPVVRDRLDAAIRARPAPPAAPIG